MLTPQNPVLSTDVAAPMWHGFMQEVTANWPVRDFARPPGITEADVDAWSGGKPTQFTTQTYHEVFIDGTVPGDDTTKVGMQVVQDATGNYILWADGCAGTPETKGYLVLDNVDAGHPDWQAADQDWIARAKQGGPGTPGGADPQIKTTHQLHLQQPLHALRQVAGARRSRRPTSCVPGLPSPSPSLEVSPSLANASRSNRRSTPEPTPTPELTIPLRPAPPTPTTTLPPDIHALATRHRPTDTPRHRPLPPPTAASTESRTRRWWPRRRLRRARRGATT